MTSAPRHFFKKILQPVRHRRIQMVRRLVRISTSHGTKSAATSARRFLCPPESSPVFCVKSVMPRRVIMLFASLSQDSISVPVHAHAHLHRCALTSRCRQNLRHTVSARCQVPSSPDRTPDSAAGISPRYGLAQVTWPSSGSSSPAIIFNRGGLSVPLIPITLTFLLLQIKGGFVQKLPLCV